MAIKLFVFCLLISTCLSIGIPRHIRFFEKIVPEALWRYHYIGTQRVLRMPNPLKKNEVTFTFPNSAQNHPNEDLVINTIQQIDHSKHQAKVEFLNGGIGSNQVTMSVTAPKGTELGTEFHFFGEWIPKLKNAEQQIAIDKTGPQNARQYDDTPPMRLASAAGGF